MAGVTVHLVTLKPDDAFQGMRRLLKWDKVRGVPDPATPGEAMVRQLLSDGMLCEIDGEDLEEARSFCTVTVLGTKEIP